MTLFFNLFETHNRPNFANDSNLLYSRQNIKYFETYSNNVKNFKDCFFLITYLNEEARAKVCILESSPSPVCTGLFRKHVSYSHFLTRARSYLYEEDEFF